MTEYKCPMCEATFDLEDLPTVALYGLHLKLIHGLNLAMIIALTKELGKKK